MGVLQFNPSILLRVLKGLDSDFFHMPPRLKYKRSWTSSSPSCLLQFIVKFAAARGAPKGLKPKRCRHSIGRLSCSEESTRSDSSAPSLLPNN